MAAFVLISWKTEIVLTVNIMRKHQNLYIVIKQLYEYCIEIKEFPEILFHSKMFGRTINLH